MTPELVEEILCRTCEVKGDRDQPKRHATVIGTDARVKNGERVSGWGTLAKGVGRSVVADVKRLFGADRKPEVVYGDDLGRILEESTNVLVDYCYSEPDKALFVRDGFLVRLLRVEKTSPEKAIIRREADTTHIVHATPLVVIRTLDTAADFIGISTNKSGAEVRKKMHPPDKIAAHILDDKMWPAFPRLELYTQTPINLLSHVHQKEGYDDATGIFYEPLLKYPIIPDYPTDQDVQLSKGILWDVFKEFPFESEEHITIMFAAFLSLLASHTYDGKAPLFIFEASTAGSGKSYLAKIAAIIGTGAMPPSTQFSADPIEMRKRITTHAIAQDRVVIFDNVGPGTTLGGDALCSALTEPIWKDRILGGNTEFTGPLTTVFYATANNCDLGADMDRRTISIRIDPRVERPEDRTFQISDIMGYVMKERPRLTAAALTLLRAYHAAGRPAVDVPTWGGFVSWTDAVLKPLVWLGFKDPTPVRRAMSSSDASAEYKRAFIRSLFDFVAAEYQRYYQQGKRWTGGIPTTRIVEATKMGEPALKEALEGLLNARNQQFTSVQVSGLLRKMKGTNIAGFRIINLGEDNTTNVVRWSVERAG